MDINELQMTLNDYQNRTKDTAIYPGHNDPDNRIGDMYLGLKLNGEAGEVADKLGKVLRDWNGNFLPVLCHEIAIELGDVLWYIAQLSERMGFTLEEIAEMNLNKLHSRKQRGTLGGSGDDR